VNAVDVNNRTPLRGAAQGGHDTCVRVLLEGKADVNAVDGDNRTPLHAAALYGRDTCVRILLEGKADVNAVDVGNRTPLHDAALFGCDACIRVLLEGKADVNAVDANNMTPLHVAARYGRVAFVRVLLEGKADVNVVDARGETLLFDLLLNPGGIRTMGSSIRTATLLLENDIDLTSQDTYGTTIVEAIKRPILLVPVELQESPVWQLIQASEYAVPKSSSKSLKSASN
jgi:hypothetical protein